MKAIILAGGKGRRLEPLTGILPKPLLPIGGRPILSILLEGLEAAGVGDVAIVVGHLGELVRSYVGDGQAFGVRVTYFEQPEQLGSGDAIVRAADFIDDTVMVIAGDTGFSLSHIKGLADFHRDRGAEISLCLKRVPPEVLSSTSSVRLEDDNRITGFVEKPSPGAELGDLAAALLHIYPPELKDYISKPPLSERGEYELTSVLTMMIRDGMLVLGQEHPEAPGLTDVSDLLQLNFDYAGRLLRSP